MALVVNMHYFIADQKVCGGDTLDNGTFTVRARPALSKEVMRVNIEGANVFNLYTVYFLPFGGSPCTDKVFVGEFATDFEGKSSGNLRDCGGKGDATNTPNCVNGARSPGTIADISSLAVNAGTFLVYSRGPWVRDDGSLNTSDGTTNGTFNNPELWGGNTGEFDRIQFVTGLS